MSMTCPACKGTKMIEEWDAVGIVQKFPCDLCFDSTADAEPFEGEGPEPDERLRHDLPHELW